MFYKSPDTAYGELAKQIDRTGTRSDFYQWKLLEIPYDHDFFNIFNSAESCDGIIKNCGKTEELLILEDKIKDRFWILAKEFLTEKSYTVLELRAQGYTQVEIAKLTGRCQTSVTKSMFGQPYKSKKTGGSIKKMKKVIADDVEIQRLLSIKMEMLED